MGHWELLAGVESYVKSPLTVAGPLCFVPSVRNLSPVIVLSPASRSSDQFGYWGTLGVNWGRAGVLPAVTVGRRRRASLGLGEERVGR